MGKPFERVTIVGTGLLGTPIAMVAAHCGYTVSACDAGEGAFEDTYPEFIDADFLNPKK